MEQKQLDEMDESFFGEEFIEDEFLISELPDLDEVVEEKVEDSKLRIKPKNAKKISKKIVKPVSSKKNEAKASFKKKVEEKRVVLENSSSEEKWDTYLTEKLPGQKKVAEVTENVTEKVKVKEVKEELVQENQSEFIEIKPAKETPSVRTSSPANPWAEEGDDSGLFKEASTWKAMTGIVVILLIFSFFTQGFNFSEGMSVTGAVTTLSLSDAEEKVLTYVNTNLLQPPFLAEVESSAELDDLYKITLTIAGQVVDSYLTKDGKLFFPQGFNVNEPLGVSSLEGAVTKDVANEGVVTEELVVGELVGEEVMEESELTQEELTPELKKEVADKVVGVVVEPTGNLVLITLNAKKWVFSPNHFKVSQGDLVKLTIVPSSLDFTFSLSELGVEEKVSGTTTVEFTASQAGEFEFKCSSCEDWRGMRGTLLVE